MSSHRPFSSNSFKGKNIHKKLKIMKILSNANLPKLNNTVSKSRPTTSLRLLKENSNIYAKSNDNLDVLNLMIKSNPNQYNQEKINKKLILLNPLFLRGTEENLKRPNFNENTEKVFYKYNLLYVSNTNNLIRTYSPKMRPMSSSVNEFNKKMINENGNNTTVFNDEEILELIKARCKDIGIKVRENMVFKFKNFVNSKCRNRCVDLSDCYLGFYSIKFISDFIYKGDRISRLNLTRNNIGDQGIELLMNAIKNSMSLISLNLTSNNITYKGGQIIFENLCEQKSIIDLNISSIEGTNRNHLTYLGLKNIEPFFNQNGYIEKLNLSGNSIKDEGFILLCKALYDNKYLQNLNISNNDIRNQGLTQGLNLIFTCKLISLNISQNQLLDSGIKILSNSLKYFPNLQELNISNCGFEFNGFEYLLQILSTCKNISSLNVSGNEIKHKNFETLKPLFETMMIRNLNLAKCSLGNDATYILGDSISTNENLRKLNISSNKISDKGFRSFISLFARNSNIESFDCSQNLITDLSAINFVKNIKFNHSLKKLNLFDNQLTNNVGNIILEILHTNKTLRSVNLLFNRIQIRTIEEINRALKSNSRKDKSKYVPDLHKMIKDLKFNPQAFKFYEKNIKYKKIMQSELYKRVKIDDKNFTKLINKQNKKIDVKIAQKINLDNEIIKTQNEIKNIVQQLGALQESIFEQEKEIEMNIEKEKKNYKAIKDQNDLLQIEYNATKKSYEDVIQETIIKQTKSQDILNIAQIAVNTKLKEINKKREILAKLYDTDNLIPIKNTKNNNQLEMIKERLKKMPNFMKKTTFNYSSLNNFNNLVSEQNNTGITTTSNDNMLTTTSNNDNKKKEAIKKKILKKSVSKIK